MKNLGKSKEWRKAGRRFVLRGFRKNGVLLINVDTGEKKLVPYDQIDLFPFKGGKRGLFVAALDRLKCSFPR